MTVEVQQVPQLRKNLGRQMVHDERSRSFPAQTSIDRSSWITKAIRIYDPSPNPKQCHGECTGCAKAMQLNAVGNRVPGIVLNKNDAHRFYSKATHLDPFDGVWPSDDNGSSGLASAKAAQELGFGGEYRHVFGGADEVVQLIQDGYVVSVGTWWYDGMFDPNDLNVIEPTGHRVGGHQYVARGYNLSKDLVVVRCWWGDFQDVSIKRSHLNELLLDDGDAHIQERIK